MKAFGLAIIAILLGTGTPFAEAQKKDGAKAGVKGNPGQFFGWDSYPQDARRAGARGRVVTLLKVDATGKVVDCILRESSGNASLDTQTCTIAREKVTFTPATDRRGRPIASDYPLSVKWQLEDGELREWVRVTEVDVSADGNAIACRFPDRPDDRRCPPDIAAMVSMLPKTDRAYSLDVRNSLHFGDVPAAEQLPPAGADVQFLRVAKIFVNEVGNVLECTGIEQRGIDEYPGCPAYPGSIGVVRGEDGSAKTTWAVIALYMTKRPEKAPAAAK